MVEKNSEKIKEKDFIKLEYIGKNTEGEIFDTNVEEEAKKIKLDIKTRPLVICVGQNMILKGIDEFLKGKETNKDYTVQLPPEKAFGKRKRELMRMMPMKVFREHNLNPRPGMMFNFDNAMGRVSSVSGGRVMVDFNNPLASKDVTYELRVKEKVKNQEEKVKALNFAFFRKKVDFEIKDKKIILELEEQFKPILDVYKPKYKELLGLEAEIKKKKETKDTKKEENKKQEKPSKK